ncbi:hypothetical protein QR680_000330 [Steinernema hermaphroditum]|uniref:Nab N-terminal domain-containing protein n=1 Tax=Steinernema hermaphroditum TaxID=289476 RepID=A0AA39GWY2_9BILA|nr:hypothetical protein QR680_000330 [Steinernema hermaphroditum]
MTRYRSSPQRLFSLPSSLLQIVRICTVAPGNITSPTDIPALSPTLQNEQSATLLAYPKLINTMRAPTSLSEWQLQAVLHRANLPKYYDVFIEQGGDDIDQFIECDEKEFLEIMRLVGMTSKPLHVRRFQNTLRELSNDREGFFRLARQQIGPPPMTAFPSCSTASTTGNDPSSALHLLSALLPATMSGSSSFGMLRFDGLS